MSDALPWLLGSDESWMRYRALIDLLDQPDSDDEVQVARKEMLGHPFVQMEVVCPPQLRVLRFKNAEVLTELNRVLDEIAKNLTPHPPFP